MAEFGICSGCGVERRLRGDGTVRRHGAQDNPCPGYGHPPIESFQPDPESVSPYVSVDPAMRCGKPTLNGTRLTVYPVGEHIWAGDSVDEVCAAYNITRPDVLIACWYLGRHDSRSWRKRFGVWARQVDEVLWHSRYDVPNPPDLRGED